MRVNIYLASSIKGLRRQDGLVVYILELEEDKNRIKTQWGRVSNVTENESYLIALKYALKELKTRCSLAIWTDNQYMASAFEQDWISNWQINNWKNAKGNEISNKENWQEVLILLNGAAPEIHLKEMHSFRKWIESEIERRTKR